MGVGPISLPLTLYLLTSIFRLYVTFADYIISLFWGGEHIFAYGYHLIKLGELNLL